MPPKSEKGRSVGQQEAVELQTGYFRSSETIPLRGAVARGVMSLPDADRKYGTLLQVLASGTTDGVNTDVLAVELEELRGKTDQMDFSYEYATVGGKRIRYVDFDVEIEMRGFPGVLLSQWERTISLNTYAARQFANLRRILSPQTEVLPQNNRSNP